jgi:hypothetical protein
VLATVADFEVDCKQRKGGLPGEAAIMMVLNKTSGRASGEVDGGG